MSARPAPGTPLTRREHELIILLSKGLDYVQAGKAMGITGSTAGCIAFRAMIRTRSLSLFQLGMWALRHGYGENSMPAAPADRCNCGQPACDGRNCK